MKPTLHIFRSLPPFSAQQRRALTIGNFDGVHRGHQAILARVRTVAQKLGITPTVLTLAPHPREYFAVCHQRPELAPTRIFSLRDKLAALAHCGIEQVIVERFNASLASMPPETFIKKLLVERLNVRWILVGADFRFGHHRRGDIAFLRQTGQQHHFEVETLEDVTDGHGHRISSSEVRTALAVGDLTHAEQLLGCRYYFSGHVVHGRKLGRTLGFPTLNLLPPPRYALRSGIYIVRIQGLGDTCRPGVASLGVRPTLEIGGQVLLEVHVLDAHLDAYGKLVRVEFLQRLRDEEKFQNLSALTAAIATDVQQARRYFAVHGL